MIAQRYERAKRALDLSVALFLLVLTLPIQAATAIAVKRRLGKPVLFKQARPGLHGKPFELIKFRTMREVDASLGLIDDSSRMTPLGSWLRATSIDELPTLWNVVRGDMSLVGPRPLLMQYIGRYSPAQARRHDVRPGLTGAAQVSGRNSLSWEEKFLLDVDYVDNASLSRDVKILLATVIAVLRRDGIAASGEATMPEFLGSPGPKDDR